MRLIELHSAIPKDATTEELVRYGESWAVDSILRETSEEARKVAQKSNRRHRLIAITAIGAAMIAIGFGVFGIVQNASEASGMSIAQVTGSATLVNSEGESTEVSNPRKIPIGASLSLGPGSRARLDDDNGTIFNLSGNSVFSSQIAGTFTFEKGYVSVDSPGESSLANLFIGSAAITASMRKGSFSVSGGSSDFEFKVSSGTLLLSVGAEGRQMRVNAGQIAGINNARQYIANIEDGPASIDSISLIYSINGEPIPGYSDIRGFETIALSEMPTTGFDIVANTQGNVRFVNFRMNNGRGNHTDRFAPYTFSEDTYHIDGNYGTLPAATGNFPVLVTVQGPGSKENRDSIQVVLNFVP